MTETMQKTWTWDNKSYHFDITEVGSMRRLLDALSGLRNNLAQFRHTQETDEMLSCHCGILQEFFDDVFGDGAGEAICGKTLSAEVYSRAYMHFLDFVKAQTDVLEAMEQAAEEKYRSAARQVGLTPPAAAL